MTQHYTYSRSPDQPYAVEMIPLAAEELETLRRDAKAAYDALFPGVQAAVRFGTDGEAFNVGHSSSNKSMAMWTTSMLSGTLEEVASLYLDQNGQMPILLDAARSRRLYELETPSSERPLHGAAMRWSLWKAPSKLSEGRDVCFLEYMDSFVDQGTGSRVWARSMQSIDHLACPASQHPQGPVRMYMRVSGMLFRETDRPNQLEHVMFLHLDGKGMETWAMHQVFAAHKKAADTLNQVLKVMRQVEQQAPAPSYSQSIGGSYTSEESGGNRDCKACKDHVSKWTIAKHCRFCDAILCKKCIDICYHRTDENGKNDRMCLYCALLPSATSLSLSEKDLTRHNRAHTRHRNAAVAASALERKSSDSMHHGTYVISLLSSAYGGIRIQLVLTLSCRRSRPYVYTAPLAKHTSLPAYLLQPTVFSETKRSPVSIAGADNPVDFSENSPSRGATASSSHLPLKQVPWPHRSRSARGSRALTIDLEPRRAEPIDLSYLSELVTPRAGSNQQRLDV
ncbi:hypothetical protein PsorP6_011880 [Peronosclerospora sorghi]|uniref:Uncharacterized protein n=1 Tax=Peronosclerospora sorghi TaxID=230839 RepID=A0ACC0WKC7_9STRA|nr:hypothetical protein PsorP6_011880 [Peronosclerospora sorghi]